MRIGEEPVEIVKRPKQWIDAGIVLDGVAEIHHRRGKDRRDPDRVHAEPFQVIQPADDARQIAGAVAVAVHERSRIDMVDDAALPPRHLIALAITPEMILRWRSS